MDFKGLAWYGSALVAGVGAVQCFSVKRVRNVLDEEEYKREQAQDCDDDGDMEEDCALLDSA